VTFPLTSKRLQVQKIAAALDMPTTALCIVHDLLVITCGKLRALNLTLPTFKLWPQRLRKEKNCRCKIWIASVFLRVPILKEELPRRFPASGSEVSVPILE